MIKRALISVYNKSGLDVLLPVFNEFNIEVISSGGTARRLTELGFEKVTPVVDYTGHPESPGGLVKTLHPKIHAGLLLNPEDPEHKGYMDKMGINPIDLVVVNLYPFEETVARGATLFEAAENIDIGGPTIIRAAAKGSLLYNRVCVVIDPSSYSEVVDALKDNEGDLTTEFRRRLAYNAFKHTANYEKAIKMYLEVL